MRQSHGRFGLIDVLAALTAGTIDVDAKVSLIDLDFDIIVDFSDDVDRSKRCVTTGVGIEGRDEAVAPLMTPAALGVMFSR